VGGDDSSVADKSPHSKIALSEPGPGTRSTTRAASSTRSSSAKRTDKKVNRPGAAKAEATRRICTKKSSKPKNAQETCRRRRVGADVVPRPPKAASSGARDELRPRRLFKGSLLIESTRPRKRKVTPIYTFDSRNPSALSSTDATQPQATPARNTVQMHAIGTMM
jgi:hypothetical protein